MGLIKLPSPRAEPEEEEELGASMTFLEHLEELRERLIKALLGFAAATIVCLFLSGTLKDIMVKPFNWGVGKERQPILNLKDAIAPTLDKLVSRIKAHYQEKAAVQNGESSPPKSVPKPETSGSTEESAQPAAVPQLGNSLAAHSMLEVFMVHIKLSIVGGIFLSFPIVFYQAWKFVAPGLYRRERRFVLPTVISAWICFILGGLFAYFLVLPTAVYFFSRFSGTDIINVWSVDRYFTNALHITLAFGVVFEEPVIISLLAIVGLVRYRHLKKWRPYVIVGMFVLGAMLTPPDPISQVMCAGPLLVLYEISAQCVRVFERARGNRDEYGEQDESPTPGTTT